MKTKLLTAQETGEAARLLRAGEAVGIPTETVYGLGCNALDPAAVEKVFTAKGRPADNPLIVHIAELSDWKPLVQEIPPLALQLANAFWPGPLTMILPRTDRIPAITAGGLDTVGVRFPAHPVAQEIIRRAGIPVAAPSGNRSGSPSPTSASHMLADMEGRIPAIVDGGACLCGVESTVILFDDAQTVRILRPGFVTAEQLRKIAPKVIVDDAVFAPPDEHRPARSPGMKYRHYAPQAKVTLVRGNLEDFLKFFESSAEQEAWALVFDADAAACEKRGIPFMTYGDTDEACAAAVFARLRECDQRGIRRLYIRAPRQDGVGMAVYNRLIRAAGFDVAEAGAITEASNNNQKEERI